ncbi:MAG: hypothetical protein KA792_05835 [Bacteroidales bacterium]|nr:hypothetical protein [Bacteroidales bacterium]
MQKSIFIFLLVFVGITNVKSQEIKPTMAANQFEQPQSDSVEFKNVKLSVGGDFAMQFQALAHHSNLMGKDLIPLGHNFNLPTANMNLNGDLATGIKVNLALYLSARHHNETWVKGGYLLIDQLPFIKSEAVKKAMNYLTLRIGVMELDYGDAHYRRSDNGNVINNVFVGNYVMDAFTTAPGLEIMGRHKGFLLMGGITSGTLKPALTGYNATAKSYSPYYIEKQLNAYWKAGYDKQITESFRLRGTLSGYHSPNHYGTTIYNGDRAGSRYYLVMNSKNNSADDIDITKGHTSGNFGPGSVDKLNAFMFNLMMKYKGIELFGTYETATGETAANVHYEFIQTAIEGLYRFGGSEQFYAGGRINMVENKDDNRAVNRLQINAGWYMTKNILIKVEYVKQQYDKFTKIYGDNAGFEGVIGEATISF